MSVDGWIEATFHYLNWPTRGVGWAVPCRAVLLTVTSVASLAANVAVAERP